MKKLFLILLLLCACRQKETIVEKYENGNPQKVWVFEKQGAYEKNYNPEGKLESEGLVYQDKKKDLWIYYHQNGNVKEYVNYREGKPFDETQIFDENGMLKQKGEYDVNGDKTGEWIFYREDKNIMESGTYYKGLKAGEYRYFRPDKSLRLLAFYNEFGNIEVKSYFNTSRRLEKEMTYHRNNQLRFEKSRISPESEQFHHKVYYEGGQIKEEGRKIQNYEIGLWKFWNKDGSRMAQGYFEELVLSLDVERINKHKSITKRDARKLEKFPKLRKFKGLKNGKWIHWKGNQILKVEYTLKNDSTLVVKIL